ncbi:hypothetical protein Rsub_08171 [Raphidocelis subcapitata]|uniref:NodB homology domain-containing protein n=1 Tax=Raphidocelis subcapitata TaxID=307507 RepID=A0A2V0P4Y6_9CHLO|nr:hypothetical protein Rsub_08171 [Raphidocelis subcapitata]|eukprot:GBF94928.1 hypothetical protein Rsub_08171 [Raphidocelis subcapitata]
MFKRPAPVVTAPPPEPDWREAAATLKSSAGQLWAALAALLTALCGLVRAAGAAAAASASRAVAGSRGVAAAGAALAPYWAAARAQAAVAHAAASARAAAAGAALAPHLAPLAPALAAAAPHAPLAAAAAAAAAVLAPPFLLVRAVQALSGVAFDCAALAPRGARRRRGRRFVALTLDDGPDPHHTPAILDALDAHGARATMFVIGAHVEELDRLGAAAGAGDAGRALLKDAVARGHELGNHTWYDRASWRLTRARLKEELGFVANIIAAAGGAPASAGADADADGAPRRWFRPGRGFFNATTRQAARETGHTLVLGSVWPWDAWGFVCPVLAALFCWFKAYPGAIIVLHDRRSHTPKTLRWLLPMLKRSGYEVLTLSEAAAAAAGAPSPAEAARSANQRLLDDSDRAIAEAAAAEAEAAAAEAEAAAEEAEAAADAAGEADAAAEAEAEAARQAAASPTLSEGRKKAAKLFKGLAFNRSARKSAA